MNIVLLAVFAIAIIVIYSEQDKINELISDCEFQGSVFQFLTQCFFIHKKMDHVQKTIEM